LTASREAAAKALNIGDIDEELLALRRAALNLGALGRHEEAATAARKVATKAASAGKTQERILALSILAQNLHDLGRSDEVQDTALAMFALVKSVEGVPARIGAAQSILSLRLHNSESTLAAYEWLLADENSVRQDLPSLYFDDVAHVATDQKSWPALISLLQMFSNVTATLTSDTDSLRAPGHLIAQMIADGHANAALVSARHFITALALANESESSAPLQQLWPAILDASIEAIVSKVSDGSTLRDLSEILMTQGSLTPESTALIIAASEYHSAGRNPHTLARLDPDLATLLKSVFPPPPNSTQTMKRKAVKKNH
jgi:hypothetical protein